MTKKPEAKSVDIDEIYLETVCDQLYALTKLYENSYPHHEFHYILKSLSKTISFVDSPHRWEPAIRIIKFEKELAKIDESKLGANYGRHPIRIFKEKAYDLLCGALIIPALFRAANNLATYGSLFKPLPKEAVERFEKVLKKYKEASRPKPNENEMEMEDLSAKKKPGS